jgi:hypothetical protein
VKTSYTIEAMAAKKEAEKGANSPRLSSATSGPGRDERRRKSNANLKPWPRGVSGNPAGKNGWSERNDLAAEIARAIFEQDGEAIFEAFRKVLQGSPYAYQVWSDRAYGKMKETIAHEHSPYRDVSDEDIEKRIAELKAKLGVVDATPQILPPAKDDPKVQVSRYHYTSR